MLPRAATATLVAFVAAGMTQLVTGDAARRPTVSDDAALVPVVSQSEHANAAAGSSTDAKPTPTPTGTATPAGATAGAPTPPVEAVPAPPQAPSDAPTAPTATGAPADPAALVEVTLAGMTLEQRIGQLLVIQVWGATAEEERGENRAMHGVATPRAVVERWEPGGVILFRDQGGASTGNLDDPTKTRALTDAMHAASPIQPLIGIDQEHGPIDRLRAPITGFPAAMALGAAGDVELAAEVAHTIATELAAVGVDLNFAPTVDVQTDPDNPVIAVRSMGSAPLAVATLTAAQVAGYRGTGVAPTVKHFPGHGDTNVDSHRDLPRITVDRDRLDAVELAPFRAAIAADVPVIMTGHLLVDALDPNRPATLSRPILTDLLRGELGFEGVVVSDSMQMGAVRDRYADDEAVVQAVEAGVDLVLMPANTGKAHAALLSAVTSGRLPEARIDEAVRRVLSLKASLGLLVGPDVAAPARPAVTTLSSPAARRVAARLAAAALTRLGDGCPPLLAAGAQVTVVGDATNDAADTLVTALAAGGIAVERVTVSRSPGASGRSAAITAARSSSLTVVWDDAGGSGWGSLASAVDAGNTVLHVTAGMPGLRLPAGDFVLAAYGEAAALGDAVAAVLLDGAPLTGVAPVPSVRPSVSCG